MGTPRTDARLEAPWEEAVELYGRDYTARDSFLLHLAGFVDDVGLYIPAQFIDGPWDSAHYIEALFDAGPEMSFWVGEYKGWIASLTTNPEDPTFSFDQIEEVAAAIAVVLTGASQP